MADEREFKRRTTRFALDIIALVGELSHSPAGKAIGSQLVRCGTSVGANYRASCRAKSTADMVSKLGTVEEEADESVYWLDLVGMAELLPSERTFALMREANEILAMVVASRRTLKGR